MGYGGALIWTGLARNLKKTFPEKKIVFVYKKSLKLLGRPHPEHIIFKNNLDIEMVLSKQAYVFLRFFKPKDWLVVDMDNKKLQYWKSETKNKEKIIFKNQGKHAIQIACDYYGIEQADLRPKIVFTEEENQKTEQILKENGLSENNFLVIEPNAKEDFSQNKKWDLENWQKLVDLLKAKEIPMAQVGVKGSPVLKNVIDLTGKTSFREAVCVLSKAKAFIGIEGGLGHGSAGVETKAIILISGFVPKDLFAYPSNINLYKGGLCDLAPCGIKLEKDCPYNRKCMAHITVPEVSHAVLEVFKG